MPRKENAFMKKVRGWGKGGKKPEPTPAGEKVEIATNTKKREELLTCMEGVVFCCPNDNISKELLFQYQLNFRRLMSTLDNSKTSSLMDTSEVDEILKKLCGDLNQAIQNGDETTLRYIMMTFEYGISIGHKALLDSEEEDKEIILDDRMECMENYEKMCKYSIDLYKEVSTLQKMAEKIDTLGEQYCKDMKETCEYIEKHPQIYQKVLELGGDLGKMTPDQLDLAMKMQEVLREDYNIEQVILSEALHRSKAINLQGVMNLLSVQVSEYNSLVQKELAQEISNLTEKQVIRITQGLIQFTDIKNAFDHLHDATMEAFQTPKVQAMITDTVTRFDELREKYQQEKDAYGRRIPQAIAQPNSGYNYN